MLFSKEGASRQGYNSLLLGSVTTMPTLSGARPCYVKEEGHASSAWCFIRGLNLLALASVSVFASALVTVLVYPIV